MVHGIASSGTATGAAAAVWISACRTLRTEFGDSTFGSWIGPAALSERRDGKVVLIAATGIARDWIRKNAWRRINEVWAESDPQHRALDLKCRSEVEPEIGVAEREPAEAVEAAQLAPAGTAAPPARAVGLREDFTFDTFVPGPQNDFALTVARQVAAWKNPHFHTVMIHGPYGFGKTHLLNAIAWEAQAADPSKRVIYSTSAHFLDGFVRAVMGRSTLSFKDELRAADLLLIDDVQFIGGKAASQEELLHTIAVLVEAGKRVVVSSDRSPTAMNEMDGRLRSHLASGLICGIEPYDRSLRMSIISQKLEELTRRQGLTVTVKPEVLTLFADRFAAGDVRELGGALSTLVLRVGERLSDMTAPEVDAIIRPHLKGAERRVTVDEIQKIVAEHYGLKQSDLVSERRARAVARPRQAAMWLAKSLTTRSYPDIGRRFGGRDHTTVLHAVRKIEELKVSDPQIAGDLETLTRKLRG